PLAGGQLQQPLRARTAQGANPRPQRLRAHSDGPRIGGRGRLGCSGAFPDQADRQTLPVPEPADAPALADRGGRLLRPRAAILGRLHHRPAAGVHAGGAAGSCAGRRLATVAAAVPGGAEEAQLRDEAELRAEFGVRRAPHSKNASLDYFSTTTNSTG